MQEPKLSTLTWCAVAILGVGIGAVGVATANAAQPHAITPAAASTVPASPSAASSLMATPPHYPRNAHGLTYGSEADAISPDQAPDLILAIDSAGRQGYVKQTDLRGPMPTGLEDVPRINELARQGRDIPVYESDGVTVIGTFHVSGGTG